jgi:hypothetical protein
MKIDEETLRTILKAAMQLERPTTNAIAAATGICEECVEMYMQFAEKLGFAEWVEHSSHAEPASEQAKIASGWLVWSITPDIVREFCDANDEAPLSDEAMDDLFTILHEQFDSYEIIAEAMYCLRNGNSRYYVPAPPSATEAAAV